MDDYSKLSARTRAALRRLGNPYASIDVLDEPPTPAHTQGSLGLRHPYEVIQLDINAEIDTVEAAARRGTSVEAPVNAGRADQTRSRVTPGRTRGAARQKLSRADFRTGCTAIFRRYVPEMEKGRLRLHHLEFITRNQNLPGEDRYRLLAGLKRYDLGDLPGVSSIFNREGDALTESKLRQLEQSLDDE